MSPDQYRTEREKRGTQASVAALLRVDPQTISRRERGEIPITHEAALALLSIKKTKVRKLRPQNTKITHAET
jgi:transcriptional regulator with XRE-family HTH domain